jgi:lipoic acid synthetase
MMRELDLHTVCEEAHCPNVGECWEHGTATFMILGDVCTRNCAYCAVAHGRPPRFDPAEPSRVAEACGQMQLRHVVLTSVDRDDLPDFGAWAFAETIREIKARCPRLGRGARPRLPGERGLDPHRARGAPEIYNHNTETVPRLYKKCRPGGRYARVMEIFRTAKRLAPDIPTKTGIILGMGETNEEVVQVMKDLRRWTWTSSPSGSTCARRRARALDRYVTPAEFRWFYEIGMALGFRHVESGPLVRSSYHAWEQVQAAASDRPTRGGGCAGWRRPAPASPLPRAPLMAKKKGDGGPPSRRRRGARRGAGSGGNGAPDAGRARAAARRRHASPTTRRSTASSSARCCCSAASRSAAPRRTPSARSAASATCTSGRRR